MREFIIGLIIGAVCWTLFMVGIMQRDVFKHRKECYVRCSGR